MQYTGILVLARRDAWTDALAALGAVEGVEVHHREEATGRVVVVVEAQDVAGHEATLGRIRGVPGVVVAEPVYHYDPDAAGTEGAKVEREEDES